MKTSGGVAGLRILPAEIDYGARAGRAGRPEMAASDTFSTRRSSTSISSQTQANDQVGADAERQHRRRARCHDRRAKGGPVVSAHDAGEK